METRYEVGGQIEDLKLDLVDLDVDWEVGWSVRDREVSQIVAITPMWDAAFRIAHALNVIDKLEREGVVRMSFDRDVPR